MKIKIIWHDETERVYDVLSFEFRTNQVANWIKLKLDDGNTIIFHNVCAIKTY